MACNFALDVEHHPPMPLPLDDPRWNELEGSYGGTVDVVAWLREAYASGSLSDERLADLINEVQHQGETSTAMYAVAIHLVCLAQSGTGPSSLSLLTQAGLIYADARSPDAVPCPAFLLEEFEATATVGAQLLAALLPAVTDCDTFKYGVAALAGFCRHGEFGRFLFGLDFYKGKFYHNSQYTPIGDE